MQRTVKTSIAMAMLLALSATPLLAQGSGGGSAGGSGGSAGSGSGDNSEVTICKTRLEQVQVAVSGEKNASKQSRANSELKMARAALASGNSTSCTSHLQKAETAMK